MIRVNTSPQSRVPLLDAKQLREHHEENVLCALWQHWHEATGKHRAFAGCVLLAHKVFANKGRAELARALMLCDGDRDAAMRWLKTQVVQSIDFRPVLALANHFPMHPRGALRSAEWLLIAAKEGGAA